MEKKGPVLKTMLLASGSFAGYNIGSGFATGIEGQQFFASWGNELAFVSLLIAMAATALVFIPVYVMGYRKRADSDYNVYHYYCGDKLGVFIDWYMYFSILLIILTMMSGAGATINQYFGIPNVVGVLLLGALCVAAALLGLTRLMRILSYAGVVIIAFVICCALFIHFNQGATLSVPFETIESYVASGEVKRIGIFGVTSPVICGFASAGLLIVSSLPWVASTGSLCENRSTAIWSGALSSVIYYAAQAVVVYLNLVCMDAIAGEEVPLLAVFQHFLPVLAIAYSAIIIVAIFSTVSGRLFLLASRFDGGSRKRHLAITIATIALSAIGGTFIPFSLISNIMFTLNGCLGVLLGIIILARTVFTKAAWGPAVQQ